MDDPRSRELPVPFPLRESLEAAGWKLTRQRAAVYGHLQASDDHPTAEDVHRGVKKVVPSISLATVYKSLDTLVDAGLATRLVAAHGPARYDARGEHHYHLRCLKSGVVEDVPTEYDPDLIRKIDPELGQKLRTKGFRVTGYRLELVGFYEDPARDLDEPRVS